MTGFWFLVVLLILNIHFAIAIGAWYNIMAVGLLIPLVYDAVLDYCHHRKANKENQSNETSIS